MNAQDRTNVAILTADEVRGVMPDKCAKRGSPMDKVQSFINAVDAVLRSGTEQAEMRAQTGKLFVDFVTDLRSQLDLHSHADRPHHAGDVLMKVRNQLRGIDYPLPEQEAVRDDLVARIEQTIREVEPGRLGPRPGPI